VCIQVRITPFQSCFCTLHFTKCLYVCWSQAGILYSPSAPLARGVMCGCISIPCGLRQNGTMGASGQAVTSLCASHRSRYLTAGVHPKCEVMFTMLPSLVI
jgi:hypothetical protein